MRKYESKVRKKPVHGTVSRYSSKKYKCRCDKCTQAMTVYQRERRRARPDVREQNRLQTKRYMQERRNFMNSHKQKPCKDCGVQYPPYVMHFDHLDGHEKKFEVGRLLGNDAKILEEIKKCDLVCANCHAERTHKRRKGVAIS